MQRPAVLNKWIYLKKDPQTSPECLLTDLDKQGSVLWCSVTQIMPVDGQHAVTDTQLPIPSRQAPLQQVKDIDSVLLRPPHKLNAQLLFWSAFVQDHMDAVIPQGMVGEAVRRVAPCTIVAVPVAMWVAM